MIPAVIFLCSNYDTGMNGEGILRFIVSNRLWWIMVQTLTLGPSILAIVVFIALFAALKHLNKSYAAIAAVVAITCQILFIAYYPVVMGLVYLSDQYALAADDSGRAVLAAAAESLLAQNNAFNPFYETMFAVSILVFSLIMLKGVFHKLIAYLGLFTFAAAVIGLALQPIVGMGYFWWWVFFMIWFAAIGWTLYRLGRSNSTVKT
jgi:hypothetical protein